MVNVRPGSKGLISAALKARGTPGCCTTLGQRRGIGKAFQKRQIPQGGAWLGAIVATQRMPPRKTQEMTLPKKTVRYLIAALLLPAAALADAPAPTAPYLTGFDKISA